MDGKGTILIIDDSITLRSVYKGVLENEGYQVLTAADGEQGWAMVQSEKPQLVLLDLILPKLHGLEILKNIRADAATRNIPVIVISSQGKPGDIQEAAKLGANESTVKGLSSPREVLIKIQKLIPQSDTPKAFPHYTLAIQEAHLDASKLQRDMGLAAPFHCRHCNNPIALELSPDDTRSGGSWFNARFSCRNCNKTI
jgi:CheY-like chemotaxis protein